MDCAYCAVPLPVRTGPGRARHVCSDACWQKLSRRRQRLAAAGIPEAPVLHLGRFQDYGDAYTAKLDVILTDPPYDRKSLPIYEALGQFALTTLVPGGWLLCLTGWGVDLEIRQGWLAAGLEFVTVGCYGMPSVHSDASKYSSVGRRVWQEHHKPLLWFQQRGASPHKRRAGTSDTITAAVVGTPDMDYKTRKDEQSLAGFTEIVRVFTNRQDVICDPCMGWGTTLAACVRLERHRCIGIELRHERYDYARQRLGLLPTKGEDVCPQGLPPNRAR